MREYIVFVSRDHYNPVGIVRSLGEAGIKPIAIVVKSKPKQIGKSKYVKRTHYVNNVEEGVKLLIKNYSKQDNEKSIILTGDDVTVVTLDKHYDELKDSFYFYNAGEAGRLRHFMNKDVLNEVAIRAGFNVAKTWKIKTGFIPEDIQYPVITKALNSFGEEWKSIVFICRNDNELSDAFSKIKSDEILVQQYIEKVDEKSYEGFSIKNGDEICLTMIAGQEYNIGDKYTPFWNFKNFNDVEFYKKAQSMIKEIGLEGIWEFEFLEDKNGKLWFLEINFRNTVLGWATTVAGMSSVVLWSKASIDGKIPKDYYREIPDHFTAIAECFDYDVRVKGKLVSKKEWKKQYKHAQAKLYKGRNDFRPFLSFMLYKLFHTIGNRS